MSRSTVCIIGAPEGPKRKSGADTILEEMIAEKFPDQGDVKPQMAEALKF